MWEVLSIIEMNREVQHGVQFCILIAFCNAIHMRRTNSLYDCLQNALSYEVCSDFVLASRLVDLTTPNRIRGSIQKFPD
jgi:hypothetical protein